MLDNLLGALWFFLPAGAANAAPVWASHLPWLRDFTQPADFGKSWRGQRILGDHKTLRGFAAGFVEALLVVLIQRYLYENTAWARDIAYLDYTAVNSILLAAAMSLGALGGDALKSFVKRRVSIAPGRTWVPFDQVDYIIGGLVATALLVDLSLSQYIWVIIVWVLLHPVATTTGYLLGWKERPI